MTARTVITTRDEIKPIIHPGFLKLIILELLDFLGDLENISFNSEINNFTSRGNCFGSEEILTALINDILLNFAGKSFSEGIEVLSSKIGNTKTPFSKACSISFNT